MDRHPAQFHRTKRPVARTSHLRKICTPTQTRHHRSAHDRLPHPCTHQCDSPHMGTSTLPTAWSALPTLGRRRAPHRCPMAWSNGWTPRHGCENRTRTNPKIRLRGKRNRPCPMLRSHYPVTNLPSCNPRMHTYPNHLRLRSTRRKLQTLNQYTTGSGKLRKRSASIAQGCPWAMRHLAIIIRPWMYKIKAGNCIPRVLADDLTICCTGHDCAFIGTRALPITHEYILDLRGHVKVEKTWSAASTQITYTPGSILRIRPALHDLPRTPRSRGTH